MKTTLTVENLLAIFQALDRINPIDRSDYFNNYYQEIVSRLQDERKIQGYIENQLSKVQNRRETDRGQEKTDIRIL